MNFKPFDEAARQLITKYLQGKCYLGSDYSYYGYLRWFDVLEYAESGGALYLRTLMQGKLQYWTPLVSDGVSIRDAISKLPYGSIIFNCPKQHAEALSDLYDAQYNRDYSEYIYLAKDFISLVGKRYNAKRNHIRKFTSLYNYTIEPYRAEYRQELIDFEQSWYESHSFESTRAESSARVENVIMFKAVDASLNGETVCDVLRVDGKIVGFSVGEYLPGGTGLVIYEKADISYNGIYSFLAHEFAARNFAECKYINRQEDMGIEGLRKSKLSYYPEFLFDKYVLLPKCMVKKENGCDLPEHTASKVSEVESSIGTIDILHLSKAYFNTVMGFFKEGIASLDNKKFFLNYTDDELNNILDSGYMLGAFASDRLVATCGIDFDSEYGDKLAGICGETGGRQYFEFSGIMVRADARRKGLARMICSEVISYARKNLKGSTLCAVVQYDNVASLANLERLGFVQRGRARYGIYDFVYMALDV